MCNQKYYSEERASTFLRIRLFTGKIQKRFYLLGAAREVDDCDFEEEGLEVPTIVPDDLKEGHFAVLAVQGDEKKRFIIKLKCLTSLTFLRLLEQAEEEYGFEQTGALMVPCRPQEFHEILGRSLDLRPKTEEQT